MKTFLAKHGVVFVLVAALVLTFVFGGSYSRYMTDQVEVHAEAERKRQEEAEEKLFALELMTMFENATDIETRQFTSVEKTYLIPGKSGASETDFFSPTIQKSYLVFAGTVEIGVIYVLESHGNKDGLIVVFAISFATNSITGVRVLEHQETDTNAYYRKLDETFFAQFSELSFASPVLVVDSIAGVTYSSRGFEIAAVYAREQYAQDFDFEIPVVIVELNAITYNLDPDTFADYPFVANVTYGKDDTTIDCYLELDFSFAAIKSGSDNMTDDEKLELKNLASQSGLSTLSYFTSYDAVTRTVVIEAKGYTRFPIIVTFVINEDFTAIQTFSANSRETYDNEYNEGYSGGNVPYVENRMITQYRNGVTIDSIAGASDKTEPAIRSLINLFDLFLQSMNGGE